MFAQALRQRCNLRFAEFPSRLKGIGNDLIDGNDGTDTLEMYGTDAAEVFNVTANGTRVSITRWK